MFNNLTSSECVTDIEFGASQAVVAVSELACRPDIIEAEINPVIVLPKGQGVVAVDALMKVGA